MTINRKARGSEIQRHQQRIFLCWNSENITVRDILIQDLLSQDAGTNCVVSWLETPNGIVDENELEQELQETEAIVLIVSQEFLDQAKTKLPPEYRIAKEIKRPILPVALEPMLFPQFTELAGAVHGISIIDEEYRIKLKAQLNNLLTSEDLIQEINNNAFTGRLFLSYRKKDLALARKFMKIFHDNKGFQSIAIWYDNFLIAGRVFDEEIEKSINNAEVFALMATPNITEPGNYVMQREYPYALKQKKCMVAVLFEDLDKSAFKNSYEHFNFCVPIEDIYTAFRKALPIKTFIFDITPERGFLLGTAFLKGIMVEKDVDRAIILLTNSAYGGNFQSAEMLGKVYFDLLKYDDALYWYKKAAEISQTKNGNDNTEAARIYSIIASNYIECGDYKSALEWSLKALPIQEKYPSKDSLEIAKTLIDICTSYQNIGIGSTEMVTPLLERAVKVYDNVTDAAKEQIILGYSNIAITYHNSLSYAKAMEIHLKAISMAERVLGDENLLTAHVYIRAGLTYMRIGVLETALKLSNKALVINKKLLPSGHPEIAIVCELLSSVYDQLQIYPLMIDMLNEARIIREKIFGQNHQFTAFIYRDLGILYARTESYAAAKDMLLPAFNIFRKSLSMNHPITLGVYTILRNVFDKLGITNFDNLYD